MQQFCDKCARYTETVFGQVGGKFCSVCGSFNTFGRIAPETVIGGFKIILELGRGSNGIVYLARQISLERDVALKILSDERSRDAAFVDDFFREARSAAALNHPAIVQGYDAGLSDDGVYFFAMELIDGETMETKIEREGALDFNESINIALRIAEALQYAWDRQKLTHGDIKPANIIINRHGEAKLADLGLAKSAYEENSTEITATPMYAPPELIRGDVNCVSVKSDIYSFGITLYQMLAGEPPFNENDPEKVMAMHLNIEHEPLAERFKIEGFQKDFSDFIDRLIAKDPDKRPESWDEIVEYLQNAAKLKFGPGTQYQKKPGAVQLVSKNKLIAASLVLSIAVLIAAGIGGLRWFNNVRQKKLAKPVSAVADSQDPVAARKKKTEEVWSTVRRGLKYVRCNDAVESIKQFVETYSPTGEMKHEADSLIKEYQHQAKAQAEKKAALDAAKVAAGEELKALDDALSGEKLKSYDAQAMLEVACRVQDFLNKFKTGGIPDGCFTADQEKRYNEILSGLTASVEELRTAARNKRLILISAAMKNYAENNKKSITENERKCNALKGYDEYFSGLNEFMELVAEKQNSTFFNKVVDANARNIAPALLPRVKFMSDNMPAGNNPLLVFMNKSERFAGKQIPWPDGSGKNYTLNSIDATTLHLVNKLTEDAFERKKLPLQKLTNQQISLLIESWIAKSDVSVTPEEFGRLVNWLNSIKNYAVLDKLLSRSNLPGINMALWNCCVNDLKNAAMENQAAEASAQIIALMHKNEKPATLNKIHVFFKKFLHTETAARYNDYFEEYIQNAVQFNPELQLTMVIDRFEKAEKSGMPKAAMNIACVMVPRLAYLKCFTAEQRQAMLGCRTNSLDLFRKNAEKITDSPPWGPAPSGSFWRWRQQYSSRYSGITYDILSLYAFMDIADWYKIKQALLKKKIEPDTMLDDAEAGNIAAPLLYYLTIAANQYNDVLLKTKISNAYERLIKNSANSEAATLNTGWAMRSALLARNQRALLYGSDLALKNGQGKEDFKNALLYLQTVLQKEDVNSINFSMLVARYNKLYKNSVVGNDLLWLNAVNNIVSNAGDTTSVLQSLAGKQCEFPELTATLLCDAAARNLFIDRNIDVNAVIKLIEPVIGDGVLYGELWYKAAILKLVASATVLEMEKTTLKLLNDYRICTVPYYPKLLNLMIVAALLNGSINTREASASMRRFMDMSPLFSTLELDIPRCLASPAPGKFFAQNITQNTVDENLFWQGCVAAAAEISNKHIEEALPVIETLNKSSAQLFWQERLLLRGITDFTVLKHLEIK